jgi:hypothetical protein
MVADEDERLPGPPPGIAPMGEPVQTQERACARAWEVVRRRFGAGLFVGKGDRCQVIAPANAVQGTPLSGASDPAELTYLLIEGGVVPLGEAEASTIQEWLASLLIGDLHLCLPGDKLEKLRGQSRVFVGGMSGGGCA